MRVMTPAEAEQGRVAMRVGLLLAGLVDQNDLGVAFAAETGFVLGHDPDTVRAPDAAFVSKGRADVVGRTARFCRKRPISRQRSSPPTTASARSKRRRSCGSRQEPSRHWYWPRHGRPRRYRGGREAVVHKGAETIDMSDAVPGWRVRVSERFA